jgi:nicotinamidase-related amidase
LKALIIVDMLNDFVIGTMRNDRAMRIVPSVRRLLDHARTDADWLVVYANDAHRADDPEIAVRGRHAMAGTLGATVIEPLAPIGAEREIVVTKRFYGAFDGTDLDDTLFDFDVGEVVLAGQHTDCAILHTAYGAFCGGYGTQVPTDAVCALDGVDEQAALDRLAAMYGVELTSSTALIGRPVLRTATSRP